MSNPVPNLLSLIVSSAPFWGAVGGIGGASIGYYQGANKDAATLVIELTKSADSTAEKAEIIDLLISRGLLSGVTAVKISEILEKNAKDDARNVPNGLVCQAIWCSLQGQVKNVKKVYKAMNIYDGKENEIVDLKFSNSTIKYQGLKGLEQDGIVGAKTFSLITSDAVRLNVILE